MAPPLWERSTYIYYLEFFCMGDLSLLAYLFFSIIYMSVWIHEYLCILYFGFFFKPFYFVLECRWLMMWRFQVNSKGTRPSYMCIHSPPNSPPIQIAMKHWAEFHVLYSTSLMVIHFRYSSVCTSILNSLTSPSPHHSSGNCKFVLSLFLICK